MKRLSNEEAGRMQKEGGKVGGWNDFVEHFMSVMVVMHTHTHTSFSGADASQTCLAK